MYTHIYIYEYIGGVNGGLTVISSVLTAINGNIIYNLRYNGDIKPDTTNQPSATFGFVLKWGKPGIP